MTNSEETIESVRLDEVRSTQGNVSARMRDRRSLLEVAEDMRTNGWDYNQQPPDMVRYPDGKILTLDHRRLVAAKQAGIEEVPAKIHPADRQLPPTTANRFRLRKEFSDPNTGQTYKMGSIPKTWGEAAMFRAANQRLMGFPDFPLDGMPNLPTIRGD